MRSHRVNGCPLVGARGPHDARRPLRPVAGSRPWLPGELYPTVLPTVRSRPLPPRRLPGSVLPAGARCVSLPAPPTPPPVPPPPSWGGRQAPAADLRQGAAANGRRRNGTSPRPVRGPGPRPGADGSVGGLPDRRPPGDG